MAVFTPIYRLTVYASKRDDPTETTPMAPIAGAPHADAFKVATAQGLAGWQPYLSAPKGRRGRIDPLKKKIDTGQLTFAVQDQRTGVDNAHRWVTAFTGDTKGRGRMLGRKVFVEESLDGGATWTAYFTGRITDFRLRGRLAFELTVRDLLEELKTPVFVGRPHASIAYAQRPPVLPNGILEHFGTAPVVAPLAGTIKALGNFQDRPADHLIWRDLVISGLPWLLGGDVARAMATQRVYEISQRVGTIRMNLVQLASFPYAPDVRVVLTRTDTGETGEFLLREPTGDLNHSRSEMRWFDYKDVKEDSGTTHHFVYKLGIQAVPADDPKYMPLPPFDTPVTFYLRDDAPLSEVSPILIDDVHPVQLWKDLLDGKFGRLDSDGEPVRTFPYDAVAFAALIADASIPTGRFILDEEATLSDWINKYICQPYNLAFRLNGAGQVVPIDMRRPSALPDVPTLTDDDLVAGEAPSWAHSDQDAATRIYFTRYRDIVIPPEDLRRDTAEFPPVSALIRSLDEPYIVPDLEAEEDIGEEKVEIDGISFRVMEGELMEGHDRGEWVENQIDSLVEELQGPYGRGAMALRAKFRRTANTKDCEPGSFCLVDLSVPPNAASNLRGGPRLMRCIERSESGLTIELAFVDEGPNSIAVAPALGAPSLNTEDDSARATLPVTLNAAGDAAVVRVALTDATEAVAPAADDPRWLRRDRLTATGSSILEVPWGKRVWFAASSQPGSDAALELPSPWVTAGPLDVPIRAQVRSLDVTLDSSGAGTVAAEVNDDAGGLRLYYQVHDSLVEPAPVDFIDVDATRGPWALPGTVAPGQALTVIAEPWTGWDGAAVTGSAGARVSDTAVRPYDVQAEIGDLRDDLGALQTQVDDAFADGVISAAEAAGIRANERALTAEKADLDKQYLSIHDNPALTGLAKSNLEGAKESYDTAHAALLTSIDAAIADDEASAAEVADVDAKFDAYADKLSTLGQRMREAEDAIAISRGLQYLECRARITASTEKTVTVVVEAVAPAGATGAPTVTLVAVSGGATKSSGAAVGQAVASGSAWVFNRAVIGGGAGQAQFRAVLAGYQADDDLVSIEEQGRDTVPLQMRATVTATTKTDITVRVAVSDPYPANAVTVTYQAHGLDVSPGSGQVLSEVGADMDAPAYAGYEDFVVSRPEAGAGVGRVTFTASSPGRTPDSDAVDVPERPVLGAPVVTVVPIGSNDSAVTLEVHAELGTGGKAPLQYSWWLVPAGVWVGLPAWSEWATYDDNGRPARVVQRLTLYSQTLSVRVKDANGTIGYANYKVDAASGGTGGVVLGPADPNDDEPWVPGSLPRFPVHPRSRLGSGGTELQVVESDAHAGRAADDDLGGMATNGAISRTLRRILAINRGSTQVAGGDLFQRGLSTAADIVETATMSFVNSDMLTSARHVINVWRNGGVEPAANLFKIASNTLSDVLDDGVFRRIGAAFSDTSNRLISIFRKGSLEIGDNLFRTGDSASGVGETSTLGFVHPSYTDTSRRPRTLRYGSSDIPASSVFRKAIDRLSTSYVDDTTDRRLVSDAQRTGAGRGYLGLDDDGWASVGVKRGALLDGIDVGVAARGGAQAFVEDMTTVPPGLELDNNSSKAEILAGAGVTGANVLRVSNYVRWIGPQIPFDPNKLYRIRARLRVISADGAGQQIGFYAYSNTGGDLSYHYVCLKERMIASGTGWTDVEAWVRGTGTTELLDGASTPDNPSQAPVGTAFIAPRASLNWNTGGASVMDLDYWSIDTFDYEGQRRIYRAIESGGDRLAPIPWRRGVGGPEMLPTSVFRYGVDTAAGIVETSAKSFVASDQLTSGNHIINIWRNSALEPTINLFKKNVDTFSSIQGSADWGSQIGNRPSELTDGRIPAALDSGGMVIKGVARGATIDSLPAELAARGGAQAYLEDMSAIPSGIELAASNTTATIRPGDGVTGANVLRVYGYARWTGVKIPYDPSKLYRIRARIQVARDGGADQSIGFSAYSASGADLGYHYVCCWERPIQAGDGWVEVEAWITGTDGADLIDGESTPDNPTGAPAGTAYISPRASINHNDGTGSIAYFDFWGLEVYDASGQRRLYGALDTNARLKSQRNNLALVSAGTAPSYAQTGSYVHASDTGSGVSVSVSSFTLLFGFGPVAYTGGSVANGSYNTTYYVYCDDPDLVGGSVQYHMTTAFAETIANGRIFVGEVPPVSSGSGGYTGGGGGGCVAVESWLREELQAADATEGDAVDAWVAGTEEDTQEARIAIAFPRKEVPCVKLISESGARLVVGRDTMIELRDGRELRAEYVDGERLLVDDHGCLRWERVRVTPVGLRWVRYFSIGGGTYAAGMEPDRRIFTHNSIALKPREP